MLRRNTTAIVLLLYIYFSLVLLSRTTTAIVLLLYIFQFGITMQNHYCDRLIVVYILVWYYYAEALLRSSYCCIYFSLVLLCRTTTDMVLLLYIFKFGIATHKHYCDRLIVVYILVWYYYAEASLPTLWSSSLRKMQRQGIIHSFIY